MTDPTQGLGARLRKTGSRERVLIVDDEQMVREYTGRILESAGYRTDTAADGAEALDAIRRQPGAFDAVVSDVVMPRLNGVDLVRELATISPGIPVLLVSGYAAAELAERGIAVSCGILAKPYLPEQLLAALRRCIDDRARSASSLNA
jgi:two-component system, cell cycle sensor histidine kinase and response regulator CckA